MAGQADAAVKVLIYEGLAGRSREVAVRRDAELQDVTEELRGLAAPGGADVRLSAGGGLITSVPELLDFHERGVQVCATLCKAVEGMSMAEVGEELAMEDGEFRGHHFTLSRLPPGSTPRDVAQYLRSNGLLLTAAQAASLFDALVPRLQAIEGVQYGLRGQLVLALHTFCLEPYAIWEPNDGNSECVWASMSWNGSHLGFAGRYKIRGHLQNFSNATSSSAPQRDVANLRAVLAVRRQGSGDDLGKLSTLRAYSTPILPS
mmetsp:Transcript_34060/g.95794  ORF Transcript_34060/g.95794 Transcript_34060/m.95794 type:complete len:261 (+) Transcript_34060:71-853(+)